MKAARYIVAILSIFVVAPIWYYLLYKILAGVGATELMWFLYYIYLPVAILASTLSKLVEMQK